MIWPIVFVHDIDSFLQDCGNCIDNVLELACCDSKGLGTNMGPTWVLSAPGGPHVGPMNFAIWAVLC